LFGIEPVVIGSTLLRGDATTRGRTDGDTLRLSLARSFLWGLGEPDIMPLETD
jgi:hypothetical protein